MARFKYKLQNILDLKQTLETQQKNVYSLAAARVREEEEK